MADAGSPTAVSTAISIRRRLWSGSRDACARLLLEELTASRTTKARIEKIIRTYLQPTTGTARARLCCRRADFRARAAIPSRPGKRSPKSWQHLIA